MKITKSEAINKFGNHFDGFSDDDDIYITFEHKAKYKSNKQNALFHSLLTCFWLSGCSSFVSYDTMRKHYKRIAGLIKIEYESTLTDWSKKCLWKAIKILPLEPEQLEIVKDYLKGRVEKELSWSEVSKKDAQITLDMLLQDMDRSAVISSSQGKKYEEILRGIGEFRNE